jgi:HlyD family secretion protein
MKKRITIILVLVCVILLGWYFFSRGEEKTENVYTYAEIKRGNLENIISSSGTLQAISTIEVGTQVSGIISKIYVDFNSNVKKGQLLAVLDTTFLAASVQDAKANLVKAQALYDQSVAKFERDKPLYEKKFISDLDFISSKTDVQTSLAALKSAKSALERAFTNLDYAVIRSPINGTVINRNVEVGQTVAASFSTPTLFTIAADLSKMQILADVDESDIGQIKLGQKVKFTVQAYPDRKYDGSVQQIRLNPKTESNVVNYTVVINANNDDQSLLPGMTATIDFYINQIDNVLLLPNTALKFQPTKEMMDQFREAMKEIINNMPDSIKKKFQARNGNGGPGTNPGQSGMGMGMQPNQQNQKVTSVWFFGKDGKLTMSPVITGSTDGKMSEIIKARGIEDGTKIIIAAKGTKLTENFPRMNFGFGGSAPRR